MRTINLAQAKAGLSALLDAVEAGEEVVITRSSSTAGAARSGAMRATIPTGWMKQPTGKRVG